MAHLRDLSDEVRALFANSAIMSICPHCDAIADCQVAGQEESIPGPGDLAICSGCLSLGVYGRYVPRDIEYKGKPVIQVMIHNPNPEEMDAFLADERVKVAINAMKVERDIHKVAEKVKAV